MLTAGWTPTSRPGRATTAGEIEALFAEDIWRYRYHPADDPIDGRAAVVESWLGEGDHPDASERDEAGTYDARYRAFAVDGDAAVATGDELLQGLGRDGPVVRVYDPVCFVMRFDPEGRCRVFTEWFVQRKKSG